MITFGRVFVGKLSNITAVVGITSSLLFSAITPAQAVGLDPALIDSMAKAIAGAGVKQEMDPAFLERGLNDFIDNIVAQANGTPQARIRRWIQCWGDGSIHIVSYPDGGGPKDLIKDEPVAGAGSCSGKFWSYEI